MVCARHVKLLTTGLNSPEGARLLKVQPRRRSCIRSECALLQTEPRCGIKGARFRFAGRQYHVRPEFWLRLGGDAWQTQAAVALVASVSEPFNRATNRLRSTAARSGAPSAGNNASRYRQPLLRAAQLTRNRPQASELRALLRKALPPTRDGPAWTVDISACRRMPPAPRAAGL